LKFEPLLSSYDKTMQQNSLLIKVAVVTEPFTTYVHRHYVFSRAFSINSVILVIRLFAFTKSYRIYTTNEMPARSAKCVYVSCLWIHKDFHVLLTRRECNFPANIRFYHSVSFKAARMLSDYPVFECFGCFASTSTRIQPALEV